MNFHSSRRRGEFTRIVAVMMCVAAAPATAGAEAVDVVFQQFGLFGIWAPDCAQEASPANPHVSITTPSPGQVQENHDLGSGFAINHYTMLSGERLSAEQLSVETIFQSGDAAEERQKLIFRVHGRTRRTMFNQADSGDVRVKSGIALANGSKTPVLHKCD
jgi:hypothetical protein